MQNGRLSRFALILIAVCIIGFWCSPLMAYAEDGAELEDVTDYIVVSDYGYNEMPEDYISYDEAVLLFRDIAINFREDVEVCIVVEKEDYLNINEPLENLLRDYTAHTGNPKEGDYLKRTYSIGYGGSVGEVGEYYVYRLSVYNNTEDTTLEIEKEVDKKVQQIIEELDLNGKADWEKAILIDRYIHDNVEYDIEGLVAGDKDVFTAHAAILEGRAVCDGIAVMYYRLALEAGLDCRYVFSGPMDHAWNIVRVDDGNYYQIDATWDLIEKAPVFCMRGQDWWMNYHFDPLISNESDPGITCDGIPTYEQYSIPKACYDCELFTEEISEGFSIVYKTDEILYFNVEDGYSNIKIPNYSLDNIVPWHYFSDKAEGAVFDEGITEIGDYCLYCFICADNIELPSTLKSIGKYAFFAMGNLKEIELNQGLERIEDLAFASCDIIAIDFPRSVNYVGYQAFDDNNNLEKLIMHGTAAGWNEDAFFHCSKIVSAGPIGSGCSIEYEEGEVFDSETLPYFSELTSITIGPNTVKIADEVMAYNVKIEEIIFSEGLKEIGRSAFEGCYQLKTVTIPKSVEIIGDDAFFNCGDLSVVCSVPAKPIGWSTSWFYGDVKWSYGQGITILGVNARIDNGKIYMVVNYEFDDFYYKNAWVSLNYFDQDISGTKTGKAEYLVGIGTMNEPFLFRGCYGEFRDYINIFDEKGNLLSDGDWEFSFKEYADIVMSGDYTESDKSVVQAYIDYEKCYEAYFLGGELYQLSDIDANELRGYEMKIEGEFPQDITYIGMSLKLDNWVTTTKQYFLIDGDGIDIANVSYYEDRIIEGEENRILAYTWDEAVNGILCIPEYYYFNDKPEVHIVKLSYGDKCATITYSELSYCYMALTKSENEALKNLMWAYYKIYKLNLYKECS